LKRRLRALASLGCALLLCGSSLAQVPTATFDGVTQQARVRFEQGLSAYQDGRYRAAVEHFKEADRLAPSARLSFNIALAYERMSDAPNALAAYRDYLRRAPEAENGAATSVRIAELELALQRSGVQQVSVITTPPGATVRIDDVSRGVSPWTGELSPGEHRLELQAPGYKDAAHMFELPERHAIDLLYDLESPAPAPAAVPASRPVEAPAPALEDTSRVSWWTWTAFGGSAALLLGAGALELSRRGMEADIEADLEQSEQTQFDIRPRYDDMSSRTVMARVVLGTGVLVGALGGLSLYWDLRREPAATAIGFACSGDECSALARGVW
jgi:tetratricopeptide (TPR) repeat protein